MDTGCWQGVATQLQVELGRKDVVIYVMAFVILALIFGLVFSMWGWFSTKTECTKTREVVWEIGNTCRRLKNLK